MVNKYLEIKQLNINSELKYELGQGCLIREEEGLKFEKINNFMSVDYYFPSVKEEIRIISFYGFPTDEDDYCLASYATKSNEDNVFGITIGSNIRDAESILDKFGYQKSGEFKFKKGAINIDFECNKIFELSQKQNEEYTLLCLKKRENLLTDDDKNLLTKYEDYKNTISKFKISLESKYSGNRLY